MALVISQDALNEARALASQGKVGEAWQRLADAGDNYAKAATEITGSVAKNPPEITLQ